jgi:3',5'-cyclic AMP phosphodiesterase CpdA
VNYINRPTSRLRVSGNRRLIVFAAVVFVLLAFSVQADLTRFAIVSDTHVGSPDSVYPAFIRLMEEKKINVIFHAGDAIDNPGDEKQWAKFVQITGQGKILHLAPGNHDIRGKTSLEAYLKHFPKPYYSFTDGDTLFILLNTELPGETGRIAGKQLEWLKSELDRPLKYKFVFLHEPLFSLLSGHGLDRHKADRDQLHQLFVQKGVALVVSGHDHLYLKREKGGIVYVIVAAAGGNLNHFPENSDFFRYIIAVKKNGGYSFVVKDMGGGEKDEFTIER